MEISSKHWLSQTVREIIHPYHMSGVTFHVSHVRCHMYHVACHMSCVMCHLSLFLFFLPLLFRQSGRTSWWRICYQWGLPHLVSFAAVNTPWWRESIWSICFMFWSTEQHFVYHRGDFLRRLCVLGAMDHLKSVLERINGLIKFRQCYVALVG